MDYPIEQVIEAMVDLVLVVDPAGRIPLANAAAVEVTGYTSAELAALPIATLLTDDSSGLRTPVRRRVESGEALRRSEAWLTTKAGDRIPVSVTAAPIAAEEVANAIVLVVRDARETRALLAERDAEIARREDAERSLRKAISSIETRLDQTRAHLQLAERRAWLGTLAAGVGCELRAIVRRQRESLEVLDDLALGADARSALAELAEIRDQLSVRAQRLLQLAIPDTDNQPARPISLKSAIQDVVAMLTNAGTLRDHDVQLVTSEKPQYVTVHRARLEQIVINVLANAAEALVDAHGKIMVALHKGRSDDRLLVEISDTGPGIGADQLARVWEPFYSTKPVERHAGLGLAVVREAVASYGGTATIRSTPGIGTTVTFDLPRSPAPP